MSCCSSSSFMPHTFSGPKQTASSGVGSCPHHLHSRIAVRLEGAVGDAVDGDVVVRSGNVFPSFLRCRSRRLNWKRFPALASFTQMVRRPREHKPARPPSRVVEASQAEVQSLESCCSSNSFDALPWTAAAAQGA